MGQTLDSNRTEELSKWESNMKLWNAFSKQREVARTTVEQSIQQNRRNKRFPKQPTITRSTFEPVEQILQMEAAIGRVRRSLIQPGLTVDVDDNDDPQSQSSVQDITRVQSQSSKINIHRQFSVKPVQRKTSIEDDSLLQRQTLVEPIPQISSASIGGGVTRKTGIRKSSSRIGKSPSKLRASVQIITDIVPSVTSIVPSTSLIALAPSVSASERLSQFQPPPPPEHGYHDLQAREEDLLFLKKRILYPGIFEQSDDEDKPRRLRRAIQEKLAKKESSECLSSVDSFLVPTTKKSAHKVESAELTPLEMRMQRRPQKESICEDAAKRLGKTTSPTKVVDWGQDETLEEKDSLAVMGASEMSLAEKLCLLEAEGRKVTGLKERYVGYRKTPGHPECIDKTVEQEECLPPGDLVRNAIDTFRMWGIPEQTPMSREQLISLLSHIANHHNNDYVCCVFAYPPKHSKFNPYHLKIVKYWQIGNRNHYTLSRYGALFISHGNADFISTVHIQTHMRVYDKVRSIPFFKNYQTFKCFHMWRKMIIKDKTKNAKERVVDNLFHNKGPLRTMILDFMKISHDIICDPLFNFNHGYSYSLAEFVQTQVEYLDKVKLKIQELNMTFIEMTSIACRDYLKEEGFSPDEYPEEVDFYLQQLNIPISELQETFKTKPDYPGQWLSFSEQRKKRHICRRITGFIRLVDYMVQGMYHNLIKNSLFTLMLEMHERIQQTPAYFETEFEDEEGFQVLVNKLEQTFGMPVLSGHTEPMFSLTCVLNDKGFGFSSTIVDYVKGLRAIMGGWRSLILSYRNMLSLQAFDPYIHPIINGYLDKTDYGDGPAFEISLDLDNQLDQLAKMCEKIVRHGFQVCFKYMKSFEAFRDYSQQNPDLDLQNETEESERFQYWIAKLGGNQEEEEGPDEEAENEGVLGLFRVTNEIPIREIENADESDDEIEIDDDEL